MSPTQVLKQTWWPNTGFCHPSLGKSEEENFSQSELARYKVGSDVILGEGPVCCTPPSITSLAEAGDIHPLVETWQKVPVTHSKKVPSPRLYITQTMRLPEVGGKCDALLFMHMGFEDRIDQQDSILSRWSEVTLCSKAVVLKLEASGWLWITDPISHWPWRLGQMRIVVREHLAFPSLRTTVLRHSLGKALIWTIKIWFKWRPMHCLASVGHFVWKGKCAKTSLHLWG